MATRTHTVETVAFPARPLGLGYWLEREAVYSWIMLAPAVLFLLAFVAYPFVYGVVLSLEDRVVGEPGTFVGVRNFVANVQDPVFWQVARNTVVYTGTATIAKLIGGLGLALVMNQQFKAKNGVRAALLLPWIVPTSLSTIAWMWIFDPTFSVINWLLVHTGLVAIGPSWLGDANLAMVSIVTANVWRAGQLGRGAWVALSIFPPLLLVIAALTMYLRRG